MTKNSLISEHLVAIERYREVFRQHGFGDYMIDFSDASEETIRIMAEALQAPRKETKEIDSCMACPMRVDMRPYADVCSHWGSPEGNQIDSFERTIPAWCPIETKPLLLRAVRR